MIALPFPAIDPIVFAIGPFAIIVGVGPSVVFFYAISSPFSFRRSAQARIKLLFDLG